MKERLKSVSGSSPHAKTTKDSGRKTEFKVTQGKGLLRHNLKCQMSPDTKFQTGTSGAGLNVRTGIFILLSGLGNSFLGSCSTVAGPEFGGCL